jgi:hypothetical protein
VKQIASVPAPPLTLRDYAGRKHETELAFFRVVGEETRGHRRESRLVGKKDAGQNKNFVRSAAWESQLNRSKRLFLCCEEALSRILIDQLISLIDR